MKILIRFDNSGCTQYLRVTTTTHTKVTERKQWPEHGALIDRGIQGNGYHGRCSNCGLALVTDLGYCSWDNTLCVRDANKSVTQIHKKFWSQLAHRATKLTTSEADEHFNSVLREQGWGRFNFRIKELQA